MRFQVRPEKGQLRRAYPKLLLFQNNLAKRKMGTGTTKMMMRNAAESHPRCCRHASCVDSQQREKLVSGAETALLVGLADVRDGRPRRLAIPSVDTRAAQKEWGRGSVRSADLFGADRRIEKMLQCARISFFRSTFSGKANSLPQGTLRDVSGRAPLSCA